MVNRTDEDTEPALKKTEMKRYSQLSEVEIRLATSDRDLEKLFRFRYDIYVEEMGRTQKYADHDRRMIVEPFDSTGRNFIALHRGKIVGCIRSNLGIDTDFGDYVDLYQMQRVGPYFPRFCNVNTKLMVAPEWRRSGLMIRVASTAYEYVRRQGMVCDFIDCNPPLEKQFYRFGYRDYCGRINHPEYGDVLPMLLLGVDLAHLESCRSPLAEIERTLERDDNCVRHFRDEVFNESLSPGNIAALLEEVA